MNSWHKQEIPDYEGIFNNSGESYLCINSQFVVSENKKFSEFQDLAILCELEVPSLSLCIYGCEA